MGNHPVLLLVLDSVTPRWLTALAGGNYNMQVDSRLRAHLLQPALGTFKANIVFGGTVFMNATQMRRGNVIKHDNDLYSIHQVVHRTPGNLRAFVQAKMRNLRTGAMIEHRFRSEDRVDVAMVDEVVMEFLYRDGDDFHFMNKIGRAHV